MFLPKIIEICLMLTGRFKDVQWISSVIGSRCKYSYAPSYTNKSIREVRKSFHTLP